MPAQNLELGRCRLSLNGVDLGETLKPVTLRVKTIWREVRSERHGTSPVDRIATGCEVRVKAVLSEKTVANLLAALPGALAGTGYAGLGRAPGYRASSAAALLRLRPEERSDDGRDVILHKAVAVGSTEISFERGKLRAVEVEFLALLDPTRTDGDRVARFNTEV